MARAGGAGLVGGSSGDDDDLADRRAPVGHGHLLGGATRKRARKSNHGVAPHGHHTAATAARPGPDPDDGPRLGTHTLKGSRLVLERLADAQRWATIIPAELLSQIGSRSRPTHDRSSARSSILRHELRGSS
ncbi:MAG: hypothetical protein K0S88_6009 [Actinomycetia bacterium]|nr:hypothetical protein [Actinomycetes bacterium]